MSETEIIEDLTRLEELEGAWDDLAVANAEPTSGPAWMLGWWRHAAPPDARLRVVTVHDHGELIGIVPLCVEPTDPHRYVLLAHNFTSSVTPLARADRTWEVAEVAARALRQAQPRLRSIALAPLLASSPWVAALPDVWPARIRPLVLRHSVVDAPTISLRHDSLDDWLSNRGSSFRANARKRRKQFERAGGTARTSTHETITADIQKFIALHASRWRPLGESRLVALGERLPHLLGELAQALLPTERFRLLLLELDGEPVGAQLTLAGGGELVGVNTGWDERFKHFSPARLALLYALEDSIARNEHRYSLGREASHRLGRGTSSYKLGFADGNDPVAESVLLPRDPRLAGTLFTSDVVRRQLRRSVRQALSDDEIDKAKRLLKRVRRSPK
ncbi:MAG TPA: GNAT family N-acetyltransferase [Solirubrobacteraceae bacterium]